MEPLLGGSIGHRASLEGGRTAADIAMSAAETAAAEAAADDPEQRAPFFARVPWAKVGHCQGCIFKHIQLLEEKAYAGAREQAVHTVVAHLSASATEVAQQEACGLYRWRRWWRCGRRSLCCSLPRRGAAAAAWALRPPRRRRRSCWPPLQLHMWCFRCACGHGRAQRPCAKVDRTHQDLDVSQGAWEDRVSSCTSRKLLQSCRCWQRCGQHWFMALVCMALQSMRAAHSPTNVDPQLQKLMAPSDGGVGASTNSKSSLNALTAVAAAVTAAGFVAGKHSSPCQRLMTRSADTDPNIQRQSWQPAAGHT